MVRMRERTESGHVPGVDVLNEPGVAHRSPRLASPTLRMYLFRPLPAVWRAFGMRSACSADGPLAVFPFGLSWPLSQQQGGEPGAVRWRQAEQGSGEVSHGIGVISFRFLVQPLVQRSERTSVSTLSGKTLGCVGA